MILTFCLIIYSPNKNLRLLKVYVFFIDNVCFYPDSKTITPFALNYV